MPRSAVFHATGHILRSNVMVGLILCAAFPLAHVFLKLGGSPESVFWAANISLALSEFVSVYLLKRYMAFSIKNYLFNIYGRCFIVSVLSSLIVYCVYRELEAGVYFFFFIGCSCVISIYNWYRLSTSSKNK